MNSHPLDDDDKSEVLEILNWLLSIGIVKKNEIAYHLKRLQGTEKTDFKLLVEECRKKELD